MSRGAEVEVAEEAVEVVRVDAEEFCGFRVVAARLAKRFQNQITLCFFDCVVVAR